MPNYKRLFIDNSYVFLTIVTHQRKPILIDNIKILRQGFSNTKKIYDFEIYAAVILPDHLHVILNPKNIKEYPKIIHAVKYYFSKNIDGGIVIPPYISRSPSGSEDIKISASIHLSKSKTSKGEKGVWQRRYFEHTIRDEDDLYKHLDYIHYNPVKHEYVQNVKDWEFSTFHKFVESKNYDLDWGSSTDIEHIKEFDYN